MPGLNIQATSIEDRASDRSFRALFAVAVLLPWLLSVAAAVYDYRTEKVAAQEHVVATRDALAEHAEAVLKTNQLILALAVDRTRGLDWDAIRSDRGLHDFLDRLTRQLPQLQSVFVIDPDGRIAASSRVFPTQRIDVSDRDYFQAALGGQVGMFLSEPFYARTDGVLGFTVTRPRDPARGAASGLVGLTLSPGYFDQFYRTVLASSASAVAMMVREDGSVLVRTPELPASGKLAPESLLRRAIGSDGEAGMFGGKGTRTGSQRLGAYRHLQGFPVYVTYSESVASTLADWYRHVAVLAGFALLMMGALLYSSTAALRRSRAERRDLRVLLAETQRREMAEEALRRVQRLEALGRLTGGVAHDFNNLLTAVLGSIELALRRVDDAHVVRLLNGAIEAARRGARLTQQMLAFSRQQNVRLETISVNDTLRGTDELLARSVGAQVQIEFKLADDLWPAVADVTQLEMAVLNLAINARDAMPEGGLLRLATENQPAERARAPDLPTGDLVVIAVTDTGTGMPDEIRKRAIEPFFTTKQVGEGTGLGLSMVHGFAQQAGGAMSIDSQPGVGTTVRIFLPRGRKRELRRNAAATGAAATPRLRVLLVDDDDQVRRLTREMLLELGHAVTETGDGAEAIRLAAAEPPDIMLVDYAMPGLNGGDVARAVLARNPSLPVVFITGYPELAAMAEWTARGIPILPKPFALHELNQAIARTIGGTMAGARTPPETEPAGD